LRSLARVPALAVLLAIIGGQARAQNPSPEELARRHHERGTTFYNLGQFEDAISEFRKGYEQKGDPVFLLNIGEAYRQLGAHEKALFFYRRYLSAVPSAPNRAEIDGKVAALQQLVDAQERARSPAPPQPLPPRLEGPPAGPPGRPARAGRVPAPTPGAVLAALVVLGRGRRRGGRRHRGGAAGVLGQADQATRDRPGHHEVFLKRAALLVLLPALWSCTRSRSTTIIDVKVELTYRAAEGSITVLRTTVDDANHTAHRDFTRPGNAPLVFPVTFGIELASDVMGPIRVSVQGADATGNVRASGVIPALKITPGKITNTSVWLGCDGACPDAGADAAVADASVDAEQVEAGGRCGNGAIDPGETCDIAIPKGMVGACPPATCDDMLACTRDKHHGSGCTATCSHDPITEPVPNDGCCPVDATHLTDPDCSATCGNGTIEPGEYCDTGVRAGSPAACPVPGDCPDTNSCTNDLLLSANTCNAICAHAEITAVQGGDGCCPTGATNMTDPDCPVVCGNLMVEAGETCDSAIAAGMKGACPAPCAPHGACQKEVVEGTGCKAVCRLVAIDRVRGRRRLLPDGRQPRAGSRLPGCLRQQRLRARRGV
jgi:hypothetical protein